MSFVCWIGITGVDVNTEMYKQRKDWREGWKSSTEGTYKPGPQDTEKQREALENGLNIIHLEKRRRAVKELLLRPSIYIASLDDKNL